MILLIYALAVYKITAMLVDYDGPLDIFERLRMLAEKQGKHKVFDFDCPFCLGVWVTLPFAIYNGGGVIKILINWFAIAGIAWLIQVVEAYLRRGEKH